MNSVAKIGDRARLLAIPRELDLSDGTYLWAFSVRQSVLLLTGIAAASWLLVEKPALRLKDWRWRREPVLQPA